MSGKTTKQRDCIFFRESAASPAQSEMSTVFRPIYGNDDLIQKSPQKLFAIPIRGARRRPDLVQIRTERTNSFFFFWAECATTLLSLLQFRFGSRKLAQAFFPLRFQAARHQSIFRFDRPILTLGTFCFVASSFHRQSPLTQGCVLIGFELLQRTLRRFNRCWR